MSVFTRIGLFLVLSVSLADPEISLLPGSEPIQQMYKQATVVCVCSVLNVEIVERKETTVGSKRIIHETLRAQLSPQKTYKESRPQATTITLLIDQALVETVQPKTSFLMFLKNQGPNYELVEPATLFPMPPVSQSTTPGVDGLTQIEADAARGLAESDRTVVLNSLRILRCFDRLSPSTLSMVRQVANAGDSAAALAGYVVLLKGGDAEDIDSFAKFEEKASDEDPLLLMGAGSALANAHDAKALPALGQLANSNSEAIKIGALQGMRRIGSKTSVPALIGHLDDGRTAQYIVVITLSEILHKNGDYAPAMDVFDRDPSHYVAKWKLWWQQEGRALYEPSQH